MSAEEERTMAINSWAGLVYHRCKVLGETKTKYRVRLLDDTLLPGGRHQKAGDVVLVPKHAVRDAPVPPLVEDWLRSAWRGSSRVPPSSAERSQETEVTR